MKYVAAYLAALLALAILDGLWLGVIAREFYKGRIGPLLLDPPNWTAAALFYLVHAAGIVVFPVAMAAGVGSGSGGWWGGSGTTALLYGALFGLFVYSAYDFTNLATLRGWPASLTVIDLAWGIAVSAIACASAFLAVRFAA